MNLVLIAALVAVSGAAKLDRSYLPPASAKTAGGSSGFLQTPLQNSLEGNNGLGGLPKGSFTNEFDGVVVDAAAAGTRTAGIAETGLGAPRISYGSSNSKVGEAAFKTNTFQPQNGQNQFQSQQGFGQSGPQQNFGQDASGSQQKFGQGGSGNQQSFGQGVSGSQQSFGQGSGPDRARAALDRAANTLRFDNDVGPESYNFAFETDNGIFAEESGVTKNGVQAQGEFSYTGDDGQVYSVSYTADEGGYQPKGAHLPTPPPIPEEILRSLEQNAKDEAAGLVDDGSYDAQKYNAGSDYSESDDGKYSHQSSKDQADTTPSSSFQSNQALRPGQAGQENRGQQGQQGSGQFGNNLQGQGSSQLNQFGQGTQGGEQNSEGQSGSSNRFGSASAPAQTGFGSQPQTSSNRFNQGQSSPGRFGSFNGQSGQSSLASAQTNGFGSSATAQSSQGTGNKNEYLPPTSGASRPQNGRLQSGRPQNRPQSPNQADSSPDSTTQLEQETTPNEEGSGAVALSQQKLQDQRRPQGPPSTSFGQPVSNRISGQSNSVSDRFSSQNKPSNNGRPSNSRVPVSQSSQASTSFGNTNEYLPPTTRPSQSQPSNRPSASGVTSQFNQQSSQGVDANNESDNDGQGSFPSAQTTSAPGAQSSFGPQQFDRFQSQNAPSNSRPSSSSNGRFPTQSQTTAGAQSNFGFNSQKATAQPDTELTTPLESGEEVSSQTSTSSAAFGSRPSARPQSQVGNRFYPGMAPTQASSAASFGSQSSFRPQSPSSRPSGTPQAALPTQASLGFQQQQFNQQSQNGDALFSPSTLRPNFAQQPQGPDDSYYYNQPSRPFNVPQTSRFPSASPNQFNRVTQGPSFAQSNAQFPSSQNIPSSSFNQQGSKRYPNPPTIAPSFGPAPTQSQSSGFNDITQASISPFPSQIPTQSSQFSAQSQNSRPNQQAPNQISQSSRRPSFGQQTNAFAQSSPQRPSSRPGSFQSQNQAFEQQDLNQNQPDVNAASPSVATQQYDGEVYDYTKPTQTLPAPEKTEPTNGQFGQKIQAQFEQPQTQDNEDSQSSTTAQVTQPSQSVNAQFGAQSPRPQAGQNFGAQSQQQPRPQSSRPQSGQNFGAQTQQTSFSPRPQFGQPSRSPSGQSASAQASFGQNAQSAQQYQTNESTEDTNQDANQFGFGSPCCGASSPSRPGADAQPTRPGFDVQPTRPAFGAQSKNPSFGSQPTRPAFGGQSTTSSFGAQSTSSFGAQPTKLGPAFGAQSTSSFGAQPTSSSFGAQPSKPAYGAQSTTSSFGTQPTRPSFGAQSTASSFGTQPTRPGFGAQSARPNFGTQPTRPSFGAQPTRPAFGGQPTQPSFGAQFGQFEAQSTAFTGSQNALNSFAGKGEVFDASRKPPASSFDSESGYHY